LRLSAGGKLQRKGGKLQRNGGKYQTLNESGKRGNVRFRFNEVSIFKSVSIFKLLNFLPENEI
jgi:hypothetical protein